MDERLKKALDSANFMLTFNNQKELIKQTFKESCLYHENGHRFTVDRELISFLSIALSKGIKNDFVILDDMDNPYKIFDVEIFSDNIFKLYTENTSRYIADYSKLKSTRSLSNMVDSK
jgi:hypothetical protein